MTDMLSHKCHAVVYPDSKGIILRLTAKEHTEIKLLLQHSCGGVKVRRISRKTPKAGIYLDLC